MSGVHLRIANAVGADADRLAGIRVDAMRPSLEAVGRFDPVRARDRFLGSYCAADTKIIHADDEVAGFFVVRQRPDHLYLDHLYVLPDFQGRGIGRRVIGDVKSKARSVDLPIRLMALNGSAANAFYQSCDFEVLSRDTLDAVYEWKPEQISRVSQDPDAAGQ